MGRLVCKGYRFCYDPKCGMSVEEAVEAGGWELADLKCKSVKRLNAEQYCERHYNQAPGYNGGELVRASEMAGDYMVDLALDWYRCED